MADSAALEALLAQAKKGGEWGTTYVALLNAPALTVQVLNAVPTGRSFGVIHQLAYWGSVEALQATLTRFPTLNLSLLTKQGQTPLQVAKENKRQAFADFMAGLLAAQATLTTTAAATNTTATAAATATATATATTTATAATSAAAASPLALEICEAAKNGKWKTFHDLLADEKKADVGLLNVVPNGKRWGVIHQIAYWGKSDELEFLSKRFANINLALETSESTPQTALDIAKGKGHREFAAALAANAAFVQAVAAAPPVVIPSPPIAPGGPGTATVPCLVCLEDFPVGSPGAVCSVDKHFTCHDCFGPYVVSEADIDQNTSGILLKGGLLFCPAEKIKDGCSSPAFSNKLVAACVDEATYDLYLKARDFIVGKAAATKALEKVSGGLDSVEQEQIRNLFRNPDGTYRAYQCQNCKFGPVDHGWCNNLVSHNEEKKSGGGVVKNSCPRCNWFVSDISQWPRWDGNFTAWNGVKLAPPVLPVKLPQPNRQMRRGRPFTVASEGEVCSPLKARCSEWNQDVSFPFAKLEAGKALLTKEEARAVGERWAADGIAEHASVASFARHTLELMAVGAPPEILVAAQRAGSEEVGHAQLCFGLARLYGVTREPGHFPLPPAQPPSLLSMTLGVAKEGCVAEFGSCIAASLQLAQATMPAVKAALKQIAHEETGHCILAWRTLLWALNALRGQNDSERALGQLNDSFASALNEELKDFEEEESNNKNKAMEQELLQVLPELGLLTDKQEALVRRLTAEHLTREWVNAVLRGERPPAPATEQLEQLHPSLAELATHIHQAVFYEEPAN